IQASRHCASRFSNGDDNEVTMRVDSTDRFGVNLSIIDEIPHIFQRRDVNFFNKHILLFKDTLLSQLIVLDAILIKLRYVFMLCDDPKPLQHWYYT
ncbi:MAG: hypothetical protein IKS87_01570, partial [Lachnospiraceae bacterium]|nr:hypothetical protein [Lachnospiraceae bacterium]